mgnify:CR=1 FL=1
MNNQRYIIAYDIHHKTRLTKVQRLLKSQAQALQYSVFYWQGSRQALAELQTTLSQIIHLQEDDIRGYRLSPQQTLHFFARYPFISQIYFDGFPRLRHYPQDEKLAWKIRI